MKIGVISDTHDHIENTNKAIDFLARKKASVLIHCGDFCAPFMMSELAKFKGKVHCVFGNIDDRFLTTKKAEENKISLYGDLAELEFNGKKIAVIHYPRIAELLALSGNFDAVFYGHTHIADKKKINNTLLLNPGELMGRFEKLSFAIYDTETNDAEIFEID